MSTIKTGTTSTTGYVVEADTTGAFVVQTGTTPTTALSISAAGVVTFPATTTIGTLYFGAGTVTDPSISTTGDANTGIFFPAADTIAFTEGGVEAMRLDASGNMGLGVVPSAWNTVTPLQVKNASFSGTSSQAFVGNNWYYNSGDKYISSAAASLFQLNGAVFSWLQAASGSAGSTISFTQAMTLTASGSLGLNTASPNIGNWSKAITIDGGANLNSALEISENGTLRCFVGYDAVDNYAIIGAVQNEPLLFRTNNTERARITSTGDFGIGLTNPTYKLEIQDSAPRVTLRGTNNGSNVGYRLDTKDSGGTQRYGGYYYQPQTGTNESYLGLSADDSGYQLGVKANGNVFLSGGATNASGTGITFPATQNASSNVNCLDDYEEGDWTPAGLNVTFTVAVGRYNKIGRQVTVWWQVAWPTTSNTDAARISGLPFTVGSDTWSGGLAITNVGIAGVLAFVHNGQTNIYHRSSGNADYLNNQFSEKISYGCASYIA